MTRNSGQSAAMLRGLAAARQRHRGDARRRPAERPGRHPRARGELVGGFDVVCGYRAKRRDTWSRRIGSRLANRIRNSVTRDGMRDTGCSLKAFRRECAADLPPLDGVHRFMPAYFR
jgi:dolichol-phosphate mannosyltransferase